MSELACAPVLFRDWLDMGDDFAPEPCYDYDEEGYLISDGLPMAETNEHRDEMFYAISVLQVYFGSRRSVLVSGNDVIHYREGDRTRYVSPDCYVWFDVRYRKRRKNFKTWQEGGRPAVFFEFTSKKTVANDVHEKKRLYQDIIKVPEYVLFDPTGRALKPNLQMFRLDSAGVYQPVPLVNGRVFSEQLGLWLVPEGSRLRFLDPVTDEFLRTYAEAEQDRKAEKQKADAERRRANAEAKARQTETQRADDEAKARQEVEAENAAMRAELEVLRQQAKNRGDDAM